MATRRRFTEEYKAEAVTLVVDSGRSIAEVAKSLGIGESTLGNWVIKARKEGRVEEKPLSIPERVELEESRREIRELKMQVEFLEKAAAFFASRKQ
jgi:transposase